jgi:hypothetical protein
MPMVAAVARRLGAPTKAKERFEAKLTTIAKAKPEPKMTISNEARLRVVLARAADAIEYLYGELKRNPPPEGGDLIDALRGFAAELAKPAR